MLEDKLLIWKLKRGKREALRVLYEKYKDSLRTIAGSMLQDSEAAEDVLHDVFVSFAENVKHLQIKISLKNYLITCVVNRIRDEFRRREPETIELDKAGPIGSDSDCPGSRLEADEKSQVLTGALAAIPFEQREVILLHLKGGLKFREIARMQQTTVSTVHGRYRYGLKKLRTILDGEFEK
ncbi:MAG: RNA polymerase sigma factor [Planctomycetota bacterium]|jgi:RNA polymerase sigma-70 factor (ECF subfamily)